MTHSLSSAEDLSRETCKGVEALRQRQTLEGTWEPRVPLVRALSIFYRDLTAPSSPPLSRVT